MTHKDWTVHSSLEDASVNFSRNTDDGGMIECRFVQRDPSYFIVYVSSHTGCKHACRFCHLTQSGQTMMRPSEPSEIVDQARQVFRYYDTIDGSAVSVNVNFMARGEPLSNRMLMDRFEEVSYPLQEEARDRGLDINFNLSTIMPKDSMDVDLGASLKGHPVRVYWSLYSLSEAFRKRWLPRAQSPDEAASRLLDWQDRTGGDLILHWALIHGENDDEKTLCDIAEFVRSRGIKARFNLVRYNSWSSRTGSEPDQDSLDRAMRIMGSVMDVEGSRIVPRVGHDVKASCGMFLV